MQLLFFVAVGAALLAVVFAMQNTSLITIQFFGWQFDGSLALVLLVVFALGFLTSFLLSLPAMMKRTWTIRHQQRKIEELEAQHKTATQVSDPS